MKFFLELQISQQNPSVSLRLPAPFSREPNLIYKNYNILEKIRKAEIPYTGISAFCNM